MLRRAVAPIPFTIRIRDYGSRLKAGTTSGGLSGQGSSITIAPRGVSSGLPFGGLIFYGGFEFIVDELDNSIKIKGLAGRLSLWRAV